MAKQKIVMRVAMEDAKKRHKALKTAVGLPGVTSAELGEDRVIVVGEGIDPVALTVTLRKRMGFVDLVSVGSADEKKKEEEKKKDVEKKDGAAKDILHPPIFPYHVYAMPEHHGQQYQGFREASQDEDNCCIM